MEENGLTRQTQYEGMRPVNLKWEDFPPPMSFSKIFCSLYFVVFKYRRNRRRGADSRQIASHLDSKGKVYPLPNLNPTSYTILT